MTVKLQRGQYSRFRLIKKSKADKDLSEEYSQIPWVVSLGDDYSKEAVELAKEQKIQLVNGQQFTTMLLQTGLAGLDTAINK